MNKSTAFILAFLIINAYFIDYALLEGRCDLNQVCIDLLNAICGILYCLRDALHFTLFIDPIVNSLCPAIVQLCNQITGSPGPCGADPCPPTTTACPPTTTTCPP